MARLLLVEDEAAHLNLWRAALANSGHRVEIAQTAEQAIEQLAPPPDLLIMDLRLPELKDGLRLIRKAGESGSIRMLVLSGWPDDLELLPERKLVHRILVKPVKVPALLIAISELTSAAAATQP
jgi:CheY-like chemotaxis protein